MEEEPARGAGLALHLEGTDGIKSLSGIRHFSLPICQRLPLPFSCFHTTSGLSPSFSFSAACPFSSLPMLCVHWSLIPFCLSSLSLRCTFFPLLPLCVSFKHPLTAPSSQGKSLALDLCQCSRDCATLPREWVSNTDSGRMCQGDGTTLKPMAAENHEYMSAPTYSSRTCSL